MTKIKNTQQRKREEESSGMSVAEQNKMEDVFNLIEGLMKEEDATPWEGTLKDYLPLVLENRHLNENAHARIWRMIETAGIEYKDDKKKDLKYKFFEKDLFGVDHILAKVMEYFKSASAGSDVARRILLLWGPVSSGKSQFAILLKRGLERFTRTKEGAVYALAESPMQENPLLVLPHNIRTMLREKYGLVVEGDPSPKIAYVLEHEYKGDFWRMPVKRVFLGEQTRVGIGTFQPGDAKCVVKDTLILTSRGLLPIRNLGEYNEQNIENEVVLDDGKKVLSNKYFTYNSKAVKYITTKLGYNIAGTENHPLRSVDVDGNFIWKNIEDLSIGDCLVLSKGTGFNFITEELEENPVNAKWSKNLALFLGLYIAEGYMGKRNYDVEITNHSPKIQQIVVDFCKEYNLNYTQYDKRIFVRSRKLVESMRLWGFTTGAHNKHIPEVCFTSGFLKEVLLGMWLGDGHVTLHEARNVNEATYGTVSPILAEQVHLLLLCAGIPSSKRYSKNIGTSGAYTIKISGETRVRNLVEFLNIPEHKYVRPFREGVKENNNVLLMPNLDNIIKNICKSGKYMSDYHRYTVSTKSYGRRFSQESMKKFIIEARQNNCDENLCDKLEKIADDKYIYLPIISIRDGVEDVDDIEVPEYHYFIANGFISHNSQSQSELVGSVNFAKLEQYGVESHPLAYSFDGELNVANRGMVEFIEMLKLDPKFRYILLTLAQEKQIKVERFPLIYADLVVVSHSNETEYNKFLANKAEEALHDRLWVIRFPYNLQLNDEVKIYEKLILGTQGFKEIHIAPHTLKIAGMFAVLSRLEEPKDKGITLLQKMHLYNNEHVDKFTQEDAKNLQKSAVREGLDGVSPRYIVNRLSACFAKHQTTSITPIDALRSIKEGLTTSAKLNKDDVAKLETIVSLCIEEYNKIACNEVQKAFFFNFEHEIKNLLENYIDNVGAYLNGDKLENEWGEYEEPNERLMRNIEEQVGITDTGKNSFRQEVYRKVLEAKNRRGEFDYRTHPKLKEALQKQLFEERSDVIRLTISSRNPDPEGLKKLNEVAKVLIDNFGYNPDSANELLRYVSNIMSKSG